MRGSYTSYGGEGFFKDRADSATLSRHACAFRCGRAVHTSQATFGICLFIWLAQGGAEEGSDRSHDRTWLAVE